MPIVTFNEQTPRFGENVFVDPMATIIGAVTLGDSANVWPGAVLRGDVESITLGDGTSFQDNSVAHADRGFPVVIGPDCVIGHMVMLHGATIGARCLIGIGSTLLNGCQIGDESVVGAHALITQGQKFPPRSLIVGSPAKVVRELTDDDLAPQREFTAIYVRRGRAYLEQGLGIDLASYRAGGKEGGAGGGERGGSGPGGGPRGGGGEPGGGEAGETVGEDEAGKTTGSGARRNSRTGAGSNAATGTRRRRSRKPPA
jgi:carbonic anhydrase/acetyltransferase-like protein (isoleucine patch superfamily)